MSYGIDYVLTNVFIPADKIDAALEAINELTSIENRRTRSYNGFYRNDEGRDWWYKLVDRPPNDKWATLEDAMRDWHFITKTTDEGIKVEHLRLISRGDEDVIFSTLAPFVQEGGMIEAEGEDDDKWQLTYRNGRLYSDDGYEYWM
jgi:hypothetical protein